MATYNFDFVYTTEINCIAPHSSGYQQANSEVFVSESTTGFMWGTMAHNTSVGLVNTTIANDIDVTIAFGGVSNTATTTTTQVTIEVLDATPIVEVT